MKVHCRTNLDLRGESWPSELPAVPRVGDRIQSKTKHGVFQLELEVVAVTWKYQAPYGERDPGSWYPEVELHMNSWHRQLRDMRQDIEESERAGVGSIHCFYQWYAPAVGTTYHAFI